MSRIGNQPIKIPSGVTVNIKEGGRFHYKEVEVTGPKGTLSESLRSGIKVEIKEDQIVLTRSNESKQMKANHGLYRSLIDNMIIGVTSGYAKNLEIIGIGYRAEMQGNKVVFSVGYSHKIELVPPEGITVTVDEQTKLKVEGADKQKVGEIAAKIRSFRGPEPYKGKGIKYTDETIKRKSAKTVSA